MTAPVALRRAPARPAANDFFDVPRLLSALLAERRGSIVWRRKKLAKSLRVPVDTLRSWESGRYSPSGAALTLLQLLAADQRAVLSLLARSTELGGSP